MKSKLLSFLFLCTSALTHIAGAAEMFHPEKLEALDEAVEQAVRDGQILSAAMLCIERGWLETLDNHYEPFAPFARPVCD